MTKSTSKQSLLNPHIAFLALAIVLYIVPIVLFPASSGFTDHFSNFQIILLSITLITPWIATWIFGVVGYLRLLRYAQTIEDPRAGRPFYLLSRGIMILVWALIAGTLVSTLRSHNLGAPVMVISTTIIANYLYALAPLGGFYLIWKAIRQLGQGEDVMRRSSSSNPTSIIVWLSLVALSGTYLYLTFTNTSRQIAVSAAMPATYYLPDWLIVLTISLPVVASWIFGTLAVANMYKYQRAVSGLIYRKSMSMLAFGIILIVSGSILLQGMQSVGPERLLSGGLQPLLVLSYVFLFVQLIGYLMVSRGSKKLTLIETA
jgi:hypothetical protein